MKDAHSLKDRRKYLKILDTTYLYHLKKELSKPVLLIRIRNPGSGAFLTPGSRIGFFGQQFFPPHLLLVLLDPG